MKSMSLGATTRAMACCALASAIVSVALVNATQISRDQSTPGGIQLLPGYKHSPSRFSVDTRQGVISKDNGPIIEYDIGVGFSSFAKPRTGDKTLWVKEIGSNGQNVMRVNMQADGTTLLVDIGSEAGFAVQKVRTQEELVEVLMMLAFYRRPQVL